MLYSKSNNVDHILNLEHKGHTIACWTISCNDVAQNFEHGAPSLEERITAAKKCRDAGYRIRFRFSPIIPVKNWEQKNREMIQYVFSEIQPEVVCLETLCHMNPEQFNEIFTDLAYKPQKNTKRYELFSHKKRAGMYWFFINEIRKYDKNVKLALCLETPKMWEEVGQLLNNGTPNNFYCCCGAQCV